jgi:V/A-type H+/Na+-transporting ATPase subunit E
MGMDKIKDAVISKVQLEAREITDQAERKAQDEMERAREQREARFEDEKGKLIAEVRGDAARILAEASIKERQKLAGTKAEIIAELVNGIREQLAGARSDDSHLLSLIREAAGGLEAAKVRIYVSSRDAGTARKLVEGDKGLSGSIVEIKESDFLGGVIAEDIDGKLRIDNTYETRLEMLLPRLLPQISRDLFGSS